MTLKLEPARAVLNYKNNPNLENGEILKESLAGTKVYVPLPAQAVANEKKYSAADFPFLTLRSKEGDFCAIFTDPSRIPADLKKLPFALVPFDLFLVKIAPDLDRLIGITINAEKGCFIPSQNFRAVFLSHASAQEHDIESGQTLFFEQALSSLNDTQREKLCQIISQYSSISHLWAAFQVSNVEKTKWALVYDGAELPQEDAVMLCRLFYQIAKGPEEFSLMSADSEAASGIVDEFEPLFVRELAA
jgi:hypothetical protein